MVIILLVVTVIVIIIIIIKIITIAIVIISMRILIIIIIIIVVISYCAKLCIRFYDCAFGGRIIIKITFASFVTIYHFARTILKIRVLLTI